MTAVSNASISRVVVAGLRGCKGPLMLHYFGTLYLFHRRMSSGGRLEILLSNHSCASAGSLLALPHVPPISLGPTDKECLRYATTSSARVVAG